jgi:mannose-6-phosphate isomerase-like protein (cupin superfamily)
VQAPREQKVVPFIVKRADIPVSAAVPTGVEERRFLAHDGLSGATSSSTVELAWLRVPPGQPHSLGVRAAHRMLVVLHGRGEVAGAVPRAIEDGDMLLVRAEHACELVAHAAAGLDVVCATFHSGAGQPAGEPIHIVKKRDVPSIRTIDKDGAKQLLGDFQDFRWNDVLRGFLQRSDDFTMSWARLERGEKLAAHTHLIQSMMIIHDGHGEVFGDLCSPLEAGDVLVVPPGCVHGFAGGPPGMSAVSLQLDERGFYTDTSTPLVTFVGDKA